ncbi:MAG TPA: hypothetical protein VI776_02770 [Anaerolineales bacterium]|nr:hypothetical protein [Anaerolineales bacterium]
MTLHLTRISKQYILQVSDRLVSGGVQDPLSNKNLLYWARGALVCIGYSGLAYELSSNHNMPTDELIAEILWGKPIPRGRDGVRPVTFTNAKIGNWLDIGQSIELLRYEIQNSVNKLPLSRRILPFELVAAGWQETRRRGVHPIIVQIIKPCGDEPFVIERPQRDWYMSGEIVLITTPDGYVSDKEMSNLTRKLQTASPDETETLLVEVVRCVASRNPRKVGPHCMSLLLPPLGVAPSRVRFIPSIPHTAVFTSQNDGTNRELPIAFSPWIIGPEGFNAPSVMVGSWSVQMGPHEIIIEAPTTGKGFTGYMGSLRRPPGP